jgi:hypothetical protein
MELRDATRNIDEELDDDILRVICLLKNPTSRCDVYIK